MNDPIYNHFDQNIENLNCSRTYSDKLDSEILNNEMKARQIKYIKQREKIKSLRDKLKTVSTQTDIEQIKSSIYEELNSISSYLTQLTEQNRFLLQENSELKGQLSKKLEVISQFEEIAHQSSLKFQELGKLNDRLRTQVKEKDKIIQESKGVKEENTALLGNLENIKQKLSEIENSYSEKIKEKDNKIDEMSSELSKEKEKNELLSKDMNDISVNSQSTNEVLQLRVNCLLKEKEILMQQKEKDHKEIMEFRQMFCNSKGCNCGSNYKQFKEREDNMVSLFKEKEKNYIRQIGQLQEVVMNRETEIDTLKDQMFSTIRDLRLDNEQLKNHVNYLSSLKTLQGEDKLGE